MSDGVPVVVIATEDDQGAEFAAGHAAATAEQAAATAEQAEATAELALDVAQQAAAMAVETEDSVTPEEFAAYRAETSGALAAIMERLDQRDSDQTDDPPTGPPAPAPKDDVDQVATPEKDDVDQDDDVTADSGVAPKRPKGRNGYGARSWWGDDDE